MHYMQVLTDNRITFLQVRIAAYPPQKNLRGWSHKEVVDDEQLTKIPPFVERL